MNTTHLDAPGLVPDELLHVPGFVGEVMEHTLATAPRPNSVTALAGALALQAFIAGRKVSGPNGVRTNVYVLALGPSGCGKDHPRKINARIVREAGLGDSLRHGIGSWQGLEDALLRCPAMLFQIDGIDGMLRRWARGTGSSHSETLRTLAELHAASGRAFPTRAKAGIRMPGHIDQPSLTILGTATPGSCYDAVCERTCPILSRMLILESGVPHWDQEPVISSLPASVVDTARWWAAFRPEKDGRAAPVEVSQDGEVARLLNHVLEEADNGFAAAAEAGCIPASACWSRVHEQALKLALIYAVSEDHRSPRIGLAATEWATRLALYSARRMAYVAHVREGGYGTPGCSSRRSRSGAIAGAE